MKKNEAGLFLFFVTTNILMNEYQIMTIFLLPLENQYKEWAVDHLQCLMSAKLAGGG